MKREDFLQQLVLKLASEKFLNADDLIKSASAITDKVFYQDETPDIKYPICSKPTIANEVYDKNTGFHNISLVHLNNVQLEEIEDIFNSWNRNENPHKDVCELIPTLKDTDIECDIECDECINHTHGQLEHNTSCIESSYMITEGCWYIYNNAVCKVNKKIIISDSECQLELECVDGFTTTIIINSDEARNLHIWTLDDANDGNFLYYNNTLTSGVMMYKKKGSNHNILYKYCSLNTHGFEFGSYIVLNEGYVRPATKLERDDLEECIADNGYEWNSLNHVLDTQKLSVGDWVCNDFGLTVYITGIDGNGYDVYDNKNNSKWYIGTDKMHNSYHKWVVNNAKIGDVLTDGHSTFIFKERCEDGAIKAFCNTHDNDFSFKESEFISKYIKPATKQQQDAFFSLMNDSGYEWDSIKNELVKNEINNEIYVSFDIAKLLSKYEFFRNNCNCMYYDPNNPETSFYYPIDDNIANNILIPCPTQDKVLLWLRKYLKRHIIIEYDKEYILKYTWICVSLEYNSRISDGNRYSSHGVACNRAIEYTLKNLIED